MESPGGFFPDERRFDEVRSSLRMIAQRSLGVAQRFRPARCNLSPMFGLFGKKNKKEQVTHTSAPHDANQGSHSGQATTSDGVQRHRKRECCATSSAVKARVLTTGYGEQVYAFITPVAPFVTSNQYVREFLPGVYRMLATLIRSTSTRLLTRIFLVMWIWIPRHWVGTIFRGAASGRAAHDLGDRLCSY